MAINTQTLDIDPVILQAQQVLYRFASLALLDPRAGTWEELNTLRESTLLNDAAELVRDDPATRPEQLGVGELPLEELNPANVLSALPASADELNHQFEAAFGLLVSSACPPYETEYINGKFAVQRAQTLADISGFYNAFGLKLSSAHPERHDHIVLEIEFMASLIGLELQAIESDNEVSRERVATCHEAQSQFFREHLSWWAPAFAHLLARESGNEFYGRLARFLAALLAAERVRFDLPVPQSDPQPSPLERPEECEGCGIAALE